MGCKGKISSDVYLVLRNRTILKKTQRGKRQYRKIAVKDKVTKTNDHISPVAVLEENAKTDNHISPSQQNNATVEPTETENLVSPSQPTNKRNTTKQQLNINYFNCRSVTMEKASDIAVRLWRQYIDMCLFTET